MGLAILVAGVALTALGVLVIILERFNIGLGKLPGDIVMRTKGGTIYLPIVTCILLSVVVSLVMWLLNRR